jgi:hypothetical protein
MIHLSKSKYCALWQCPKIAWLNQYKPEEKTLDASVEARMAAGNEVGDLAMGLFGDYVEVTAYDGEKLDLGKMIENTRIEMEKGTPVICEAAFSNYNNYCAVDILRKTESGYDFYEVKNAAELQAQFVRDAGFQYYIMARCGMKIGRIFIVLHGPDEEKPFVPHEVTKEAKGFYQWVNDHIWDLNRMQKQPEEPVQMPGGQCTEPYPCWYYGYCHGGEESE